jgi:hypothetical protein
MDLDEDLVDEFLQEELDRLNRPIGLSSNRNGKFYFQNV